MNIEDKDLENTDKSTLSTEAEQAKFDANDSLEDSIIRNDTIPETSKDTPGSNGAFPVGAFDTSKD